MTSGIIVPETGEELRLEQQESDVLYTYTSHDFSI